jgi:O-antigen/teichoic acid export membrane protein
MTEALSPFRRAGQGFAWRGVVSVVGAAGAVGVIAAAARVLSDTDFSRFVAVWAALTIAPVLARHGTGTAVVRHIAEAREDPSSRTADDVAWHALRATMLLSVPVGLALAPVALGLGGRSGLLALGLGGVVLALESVRATVADVALGYERQALSALGGHQVRTIALAAALGSAAARHQRLSLPTVLALAAALSAVHLVIVWRLVHPTISHERDVTAARFGDLSRRAIPYFAIELSAIAVARFDVLVGTHLLGPQSAARYAAASALATQLLLLVSVAATALPPVVASLATADRWSELTAVLRTQALVVFAMTAVGCALVFTLAPDVLRVLYGSGYGAAATPLRVLLMGTLGAAFAGNSIMVGSMIGLVGPTARLCAIGAAAGMVAMAIGAGAGGSTGLAATSSVASVAVNLSAAALVFRRRQVLVLPATRPWREGFATVGAAK